MNLHNVPRVDTLGPLEDIWTSEPALLCVSAVEWDRGRRSQEPVPVLGVV